MGCFRAVAVAIALLGVGCRHAESPRERLAGLYVLQSINGAPIPAVASEGGGQRYTVLADSLLFDLDGNVRRSYRVRWISTTPPVIDTVYSQTFTIPYSIEQHQLTIGIRQSCGPNANCVGWDEGTIDSRTARVKSTMLWSGAPEFVFTRTE